MRRIRIISTAVATILGAMAVAVVTSTGASASAPTVLYVAQGGTDTGSCPVTSPCATVTYAQTVAGPNPTIKVAGTIHDRPDIRVPLTITGVNSPVGTPPILNGSGQATVLVVESGIAVTLDHLSIENGSATGDGGGIYNSGTLTVSKSTISGNSAPHWGGGVYNGYTATVAMSNSTVSGNTASDGGGVFNGAGTVTMTDTTISGNTASNSIGGFDNYRSFADRDTVVATIVAQNTGGNCGGDRPSTGGYNLTNDATGDSCGFTSSTDLVNKHPQLGPLQDNGGLTNTQQPAPSSPAADVIPLGTTLNQVSVCPGTDQRGFPRPAPGETACTIGAVEAAGVPGAPVIGSATGGNGQTTVTFSPPTDNGGSEISGYTATASDSTSPGRGGETASGTSSPLTVTGLTNGDTYTFTVTATNAAGTGPPSAPSNAVTLPAIKTTTSVTVIPNSVQAGAKVVYVASVNVKAKFPAPTGTVTFAIGTTTLCQAALTGGAGACGSTNAPVGKRTVIGTYSGSPNYLGSSGTATLQVGVTTTSLVPSANPAPTGLAVTYTATVAPVPNGGTIGFTSGTTGIPGCRTVAVNTKTGQAACTVTYSTVGSYQIKAAFSGTTNFARSTSPVVTETITS